MVPLTTLDGHFACWGDELPQAPAMRAMLAAARANPDAFRYNPIAVDSSDSESSSDS